MTGRSPKPSKRVSASYATSGGPAPGETPAAWPNRDQATALNQVAVYEQQRADLERGYASDPRRPWVAKIQALQRSDGGVHTMTVWTLGVPTLLPAADVIGIMEDAHGAARQTLLLWNTVAAVVADTCWQVTDDLEPPRVFAFASPDDEAMQRLRTQALPS